MRVDPLICRMLFITAIVFASDYTTLLVKHYIETLKATGKIPLFICLSGESSIQMYSWISTTHITSVVVDSCFVKSGYRRQCHSFFLKLLQGSDANSFVFLVPSLPIYALRGLCNVFRAFQAVPILVILSFDKLLPEKQIPCFIVWAPDTPVDDPADNSSYHEGEDNRQWLSEDTFNVQDESRYLKNINLVIYLHGLRRRNMIPYTRYPEAVAYLDALELLNVTPIFTNKKDTADIFIQPSIISPSTFFTNNIDGVYTCLGHGFFTGGSLSNSFNIISLTSLILLLSALILVGAIIMATICLTITICPRNSCRISEILLFLVSSSVGRSPVALNVGWISFRMLLLVWLFGTFIIGVYIQTEITAEYNVPMYSPSVETVEDLERVVSSGMIQPCVDELAFLMSDMFIREYYAGFIETLRKIVIQNMISCTSYFEECYSRTRDNTHIYIAPLDFARRKAAYEWNLQPGKEVLFAYCTAAPAKKTFRYVVQHRRLVLSLAEAGLTLHEERRQTWNHTEKNARKITFPFSTQFLVLIYGCVASFVVLLCEIFFSKAKCHNRIRANCYNIFTWHNFTKSAEH